MIRRGGERADNVKEGLINGRVMGRLLFKGARAGCDARTLRRYLHVVPKRTERTPNRL